MAIQDFVKDAKRVIIRDQLANTDDLIVDASIGEQYTFASVITDYPVERGINAVDTSRPLPELITLSIVQSDTPLTVRNLARQSSTEAQVGNGLTRWQEALTTLRGLKDDATIIELVTTLETYKDLLIERIDVPRDARTSSSLFATVSFKRVIVADRVTVDLPKAAKPASKGQKATSQAPPAQTEKASSLLFKASGL